MAIYYQNSNREILCFRHAVIAAQKGETIETLFEDESDCSESGGWYGPCRECEKEE